MRIDRATSPRSDKALYVFAALLLAVTTSILSMAAFGMETLSEVRAYVGGEGWWIKGQKDAVYFLANYSASHDEHDYQKYLASLEVPISDARARLEMNKPVFDKKTARDELVAGRNHPEDVPGMIRLYRNFRSLERLASTVRIWEKGDQEIQLLQVAGERIHREIVSGRPDAPALQRAWQDINHINQRTTLLESQFSTTLGETARWFTRLLSLLNLLVGSLLVSLAVWLSRGLLRRLRQGEEAVRQSELIYKSLVEQSPFGIFRSTPDGRILNANPAMVAMLGYESEPELLEKNLPRDIYVDAEARNRTIEALAQGKRTSENLWRRKGGSTISVRQSAQVVLDAYGKPEQFNTIAEDVSERRGLEAQLRQAQKMEAVGLLASGVAHDFNNLLVAILGPAEILLEELPGDSKHRDDMNEIRQAALRAAELTSQLLAFGRKQALAPRLINLNAVVEVTEKLLRRTLGEDIDLRTFLSPDLGTVQADPNQLEQVIINLAVNARDAMSNGGKLTVETANVELEPSYVARHPMVQAGRYVMIAVSDTGAGMNADVQARIFEPLFTTKPRNKGTGLGPMPLS